MASGKSERLRKVARETAKGEGRAAALLLRARDTNPYPVYDTRRYQWFVGYDSIREEAVIVEITRESTS